MYSMTGFGRGVCQIDGREMTIELKSVNHRFLDLSMKMARSMNFLEDAIRKQLQEALARGHVDVSLSYVNRREDGREAAVDHAVVRAYQQAAQELAQMGVEGQLRLADVLRLPDAVVLSEKQEDQQALTELMCGALDQAVNQLKQARAQEGMRLKADIESRLAYILEKRAAIAQREPMVVADYRDKLRDRIAQLLGDQAQLDEARLMQEVALFADKASIAEELTRLQAHVQAIEEAMASDQPVGRRLDFIVQELNRETNTIGSKAADMQILALVVDIKAEIEKIREQVQNIE
jgi:uncharacterized protein (TIGR00255 family)